MDSEQPREGTRVEALAEFLNDKAYVVKMDTGDYRSRTPVSLEQVATEILAFLAPAQPEQPRGEEAAPIHCRHCGQQAAELVNNEVVYPDAPTRGEGDDLAKALRLAAERLHDLSDDPRHMMHTFDECPHHFCEDARSALRASTHPERSGRVESGEFFGQKGQSTSGVNKSDCDPAQTEQGEGEAS